MMKSLIISALIILAFSIPSLAQSISIGAKINPALSIKPFAELYLSSYFSLSLAAGLQTQTPSLSVTSVEAVGKFYSPTPLSPITLYGGAGGRLQGANFQQRFAILLFGLKLDLGNYINLFGEVELSSLLYDLRWFYLKPWAGIEIKFGSF